MNKLILLAPVGDFESLVAAIHNGADAVYLGPKLFNARRLAGNFTIDQLKKVIQYAHLYQVKVYLTLNTLIKNNEIGAFLNQVSIAQQFGADAIILQDLTFAPLIKKHFPNLEIHASTQATIMNSSSIKYWQKYVDQFVLTRELTKKEVRTIFDKTKAKLEIFVHGHLCSSYSGQCLISSLIGKRSGNRGMCASSCRKQYNGENYLLSAKDLCMIGNIKDIVDSGATTVKIEGRMKPAEYVATTTKAYREQIDSLISGHNKPITNEKINELKMAFNREFTPGYFNDETKIIDQTYSAKRGVFLGTVRNGLLHLEENLELHDGVGIIEKGKRVGDYVKKIIVNGAEINTAKKGEDVKLSINGFRNGAKIYLMTKNQGNGLLINKKIPLKIVVSVRETTPVIINVVARDKELEIVLSTIAKKPERHPLTEELLSKEMEKYESDIFIIDKLTIDTDNSFVAKSALTTFRKELDQKILDFLYPINLEKETITHPSFIPLKGTNKIIHVKVYSVNDVREAVNAGADIIYYDAFAKDLEDAMTIVHGTKSKLYLHTPMVMTDKHIEQLQTIINKNKPDGVVANNVGVLGMGLKIPIILGYQMNIFNDNQLQVYNCLAVISIELNLKELQEFQNKKDLIFYAHGYPTVMTFKEHFDASSLTDKKGYTFRLRKTSTGTTEMLYSKAIGTLQHTPKVIRVGVTQFFLDLEKDVFNTISLYNRLIAGESVSVASFKRDVTIGNLEKGVM
ncbi:MAG: DUF3656 domain-containing protein [archaeon]|nr:DUF3656 domain-containing protein [archaeon]